MLSDEFSTDGMEMQLPQHQDRSTPVPNSSNLYAYGAETWTLLLADMNTLEAFHMRRQQQILDIRWWPQVSSAEVLQRPGLSTIIGDILWHRR